MSRGLSLLLLASLNIVFVFIFQWYLVYTVGVGAESDAFVSSITIPQIVLSIFSGSLTNVLVPLWSGESEGKQNNEAWFFLLVILAVFGGLSYLLFCSADAWVPIIFSGFETKAKQLAVELTKIQLISLVLNAISGLQFSVCQARKRFVYSEFVPVFSGAVSFLLLIWFLPDYGIQAAAWLVVLRSGLQVLVMLPLLGRPNFVEMDGGFTGDVWHRIKPLIFGTVLYRTEPMLDRYLLSGATAGSLSTYYLCQQIINALCQVVSKAFVSPIVPDLGVLYRAADVRSIKSTYAKRLRFLIGLCLSGMIVFFPIAFCATDVLAAQFGLNPESIEGFLKILLSLSGMMLGGVLGQLVSSAFYVCSDTRTPTRISIISLLVYVPLKIYGFMVFGPLGLAILTSFYYMVNFFIQHRLFNQSNFL